MTAHAGRVVWGLIGAGDIARKRVGEALMSAPGSALQAVAAAHPESAAAFARDFGVPRAHAEWMDLVRDPDITAVYVASPVAFHKAQVVAAARAGKHVLCEKPLGLKAAEGRAMVRACRKAGVTFGTAYYRRFYPVVRRCRELIASGEIGRPLIVQLNAFSLFDPGPDHPRRWLLDGRISGGGPLKDFGCHRIDLLLALFGNVVGQASLRGNLRWPRPVEDTAVLDLRFSDGPFAQIAVSHAVREPADTLDVYGSEGSLHVPSLNGGKLRVRSRTAEREETCAVPANRHRPLVEDFIGAVREGRPCAVTGETGIAVDRIMDRVYRG